MQVCTVQTNVDFSTLSKPLCLVNYSERCDIFLRHPEFFQDTAVSHKLPYMVHWKLFKTIQLKYII